MRGKSNYAYLAFVAASKDRTEETRGCVQLRGWFSGARDGTTRPHSRLAALLGVTKPAIGYWLKGTSRPEPHLRAAIEAITGIPAGDWDKDEERKQYQETLVRLASDRERADTDPDDPPSGPHGSDPENTAVDIDPEALVSSKPSKRQRNDSPPKGIG